MKVYNLTDIETPTLKRLGLVGVPIVVGREVIEPGGVADIGDTEMTRRDILSFTTSGALAAGVRPPSYLLAQAERASKARLAALTVATQESRKEK